MITHLLYLHGFRSSPQSSKAQYLAQLLEARYPKIIWCCPQLPPSPKSAGELILNLTQDWPVHSSAVVGSSLGGFYANWIAKEKGIKSVLINPACHPARDLKNHIGEQTVWQSAQESFYFRPEYIDELLSMSDRQKDLSAAPKQAKGERPLKHHSLNQLSPQLLMACTGDEVLDWQEMVSFFSGADHYIVQGSDHAMSDFHNHASYALDFLMKNFNIN